jgi:hypothetical protein
VYAACEPSLTARKQQNRGIFDTFPLSLITTQSIAGLGELADTRLDVAPLSRFTR